MQMSDIWPILAHIGYPSPDQQGGLISHLNGLNGFYHITGPLRVIEKPSFQFLYITSESYINF